MYFIIKMRKYGLQLIYIYLSITLYIYKYVNDIRCIMFSLPPSPVNPTFQPGMGEEGVERDGSLEEGRGVRGQRGAPAPGQGYIDEQVSNVLGR